MNYSVEKLIQEQEKETALEFIFFWGHTLKGTKVDKSCLSQWFPCNFVVDGTSYISAEHWMMAQKALLFDDQEQFEKIIACKTPKETKDFGRQVKNFNSKLWSEKRYEIVTQGNIHKFEQNDDLKEYLLSTSDKVLVEASPVDAIWGIGLSVESKKVYQAKLWKGINLLGFALMEARDYIK